MFNRKDWNSNPKRLPEFLSEREMNKLIDSISNLRDKTILETMFACGCRPKELREMSISRLDLDQREIKVMGKDGHGAYVRERLVFLNRQAVKLLKQYIPQRRPGSGYEDILFLSKKGRALTPVELNGMVRKHVLAILGKKIRHKNAAYILRHSFATCMMNRNVDLPFISELLGHENFSSCQHYTHVAVQRLIDSHKKFHPRG